MDRGTTEARRGVKEERIFRVTVSEEYKVAKYGREGIEENIREKKSRQMKKLRIWKVAE